MFGLLHWVPYVDGWKVQMAPRIAQDGVNDLVGRVRDLGIVRCGLRDVARVLWVVAHAFVGNETRFAGVEARYLEVIGFW